MLDRDPQTEIAVLTMCLESKEAFAMCSGLYKTDFTNETRARIWGIMAALNAAHRPIDMVTVSSALAGKEEEETLEKALGGGCKYCIANAREYVRILKECTAVRRIRESIGSLSLGLDSMESLDEAVASMQNTVEMIYRTVPKETKDNQKESYEYLLSVQEGKIEGYFNTGIDRLDDFSPGHGETVIVAARPSVGKSALAMQIANNAVERGKHIVFFHVEMTPTMVAWRRICSLAGINYTQLRRPGGLSREEWDKVNRAYQTIRNPMYHEIYTAKTLGEIISETTMIDKKHHVDAVFIDHIHLMKHPKADRADLRLKETVDGLKNFGKDIGATMFILGQLNRNAEHRENKRPNIADFRETGAGEEDCDAMWLLWRPDKNEMVPENKMIVICAKNRNGPTGEVEIGYNYKTGYCY